MKLIGTYLFLVATFTILMVSCDKLKDLEKFGKQLGGSAGTETVNSTEAKKIIDTESRLVIVEFYTDT